jgi:hypothetical protein
VVLIDYVDSLAQVAVQAGAACAPVPVHHGRDVAKGTLRGILSDTDLTVEELHRLL